MSENTLLIEIDPEIKVEFEETCSQIGLTPKMVINQLIKNLVKNKTNTFEVEEMDAYFTKENLAYIDKGIEQIKNGQVIIHDLIEDLDE